MRIFGLLFLIIAAFIAVFLYLKPFKNVTDRKTNFHRLKNAEKSIDDFNKATDQRIKELEAIE